MINGIFSIWLEYLNTYQFIKYRFGHFSMKIIRGDTFNVYLTLSN